MRRVLPGAMLQATLLCMALLPAACGDDATSTDTGVGDAATVYRRSTNWSERELIQWRLPVGGGPLSKTWPRWLSQREQIASTAPSFRVAIAPGSASQKEGHPQESYLVFES